MKLKLIMVTLLVGVGFHEAHSQVDPMVRTRDSMLNKQRMDSGINRNWKKDDTSIYDNNNKQVYMDSTSRNWQQDTLNRNKSPKLKTKDSTGNKMKNPNDPINKKMKSDTSGKRADDTFKPPLNKNG